jgi:hypothetical protein
MNAVQRYRWDTEAGGQGHGAGDKPTVRSSVKRANKTNDNLVNRTRQFWQMRLGRDLSEDAAQQIAEHGSGFLSSLLSGREQNWPLPQITMRLAHDNRTSRQNCSHRGRRVQS